MSSFLGGVGEYFCFDVSIRHYRGISGITSLNVKLRRKFTDALVLGLFQTIGMVNHARLQHVGNVENRYTANTYRLVVLKGKGLQVVAELNHFYYFKRI